MDNLVFSLNATVPIFLMMILGLFFNKIGWMDEEFANKMNKFVFRVPLPRQQALLPFLRLRLPAV